MLYRKTKILNCCQQFHLGATGSRHCVIFSDGFGIFLQQMSTLPHIVTLVQQPANMLFPLLALSSQTDPLTLISLRGF